MGASVGGIRAGWAGVMIAVVAASLMLEGLVVAAATSHVVGGNATGWAIPSNTSFYDEWSASETFVVGDTLVFNFPAGVHNVIQVPKSSYDACSAQNQIGSNLTTSPATVTITSSGTHYYICGFSGHCLAGQRLAITASSSASPTPAPTPGGSTPSGSPTPNASGPTPGGSTPSGTPTPNASGPAPGSSGGSNSAPPPRPFVISLAVAFLSVASSCLLFL